MQRKFNLIIAAHPDDEILGCGGLISKMKGIGIDSFVLILTDGVKNRYPKRMISHLKENALAANKTIGTKEVFFENLPNQKLDIIPLTKIIQIIEKYINKLNIDAIFTHHSGDLNKDHRLVYEATMTALRPLPGQTVIGLYTYYVPSSTEWNHIEKKDVFIPNVFVDIKNEIETKIRALSCYKSEIRPYPHPRSKEAVRIYAQKWGIDVGLEYVEPFRLIREIQR